MDQINNKNILFHPKKSTRAFEKISDDIKQKVFKGILTLGDKLPPEIELARQFNVGRQTIREAMRVLELSGFLKIKAGKHGGAFIENKVGSTISDSFLDAIHIKDIDANEIAEARIEIEKIVMKNVLKNANNSDLQKIRQNISDAKNKIINGHQAFYENIDFHKILAKASKNYVYFIVVEAIMAAIVDYFRQLEPSLDRSKTLNKSKNIVNEHEAILNAIEKRQNNMALQLLEKHLMGIMDWFR